MSTIPTKLRILEVLAEGGEFTRADFVALYGSGADRAAIELDIADKVSVRVDGAGIAYYSKRKAELPKPRVTYPTAFSKRGK